MGTKEEAHKRIKEKYAEESIQITEEIDRWDELTDRETSFDRWGSKSAYC